MIYIDSPLKSVNTLIPIKAENDKRYISIKSVDPTVVDIIALISEYVNIGYIGTET